MDSDKIILEAQAGMCGLSLKEFAALDPKAQERVRRTMLEVPEDHPQYNGPVKRSVSYKRRNND